MVKVVGIDEGTGATADGHGDGTFVVMPLDGQPFETPLGEGALRADFDRSGDDLVIRGEGGQVLVPGYFSLEEPGPLSIDGAGFLAPSLLEHLAGPRAEGQYAQTGASDASPVASISSLTGDGEVIHADGTRESLGDNPDIYSGDVVVQSGGGAVVLAFVDGTSMSLSGGARIVIDELVYDPSSTSNVGDFSLLQGVIAFVAGELAPSGGINVTTPVSTIGIRGTSVGMEARAEGLESHVTLLQDPDGSVGAIQVQTQAGSVMLEQVNETTTVTTALQPPSAPEVLTAEQVEALYGDALEALRGETGGSFTGQQRAESIDVPEAGERVVVQVQPGDTLPVNFDPTAVDVQLQENGDLVLTFPNGGVVVLEGFAVAAASGGASILLPDGTLLAGNIIVAQLGGDLADFEVAAGPGGGGAGSGGGGSTYNDDLGEIIGLYDAQGPIPGVQLEPVTPIPPEDEAVLPEEGEAPNFFPTVQALIDDGAVEDSALEGGTSAGSGSDTTSGDLNYDFGGDGPASSGAFVWSVEVAVSDGETGEPVALTAEGLPVTWSASPDGLTLTASDENGTVAILQVIGDVTEGNWTFQQFREFDHPDAGADGAEVGANDPLDLQFTYTITDSNGDQATGGLIIHSFDDGPIVVDEDAVLVVEGGDPIVGNVLDDGDTEGADQDTLAVTVFGYTDAQGNAAVATAGDTVTTFEGGELVVGADGIWTYTPPESVDTSEGSVNVTFSYTIEDRDGDTATGQQSIVVGEANVPFTAGAQAGGPVREAALDGGGGVATGTDPTSPDEIDSDTLTYDFGGDGPAAVDPFVWNTALLPALTSEGNPVVWTVSSDGLTVTGATDVGTVATLNLTDVSTGAWTFTLVRPIDNQPGEDSQGLTFGYTIEDLDGNTATGSLAITVADDKPIAVDEEPASVDEGAAAIGGNVLDNGDTEGADQDVLQVTEFVFTDASGTVHAAAAVGTTVIGAGGESLTVDADGTWSYTPPDTLDHDDETPDVASFSYTITDRDGDTDTATQTITINDIADLSGGEASATVAETALGSDEGDLSTGSGGGVGSVTGTLGYDAGTDLDSSGAPGFSWLTGPGSLSFVDDADGDTVVGEGQFIGFLTSGGDPIIWTIDSNDPTGFTIIGTAEGDGPYAGQVVARLTLNDPVTGAYTFDLEAPIGHPDFGETLDQDTLTLTFGYEIEDRDGDTAQGTLAITVTDDGPSIDTQVFDAPALSVDESDLSVGAALSFADDGPSIDTQVFDAPALSVDESDLSQDATQSFAGAFDIAGIDYGADGEAAGGGLAYTLSLTSEGIATGFNDVATDQAVTLHSEGVAVAGTIEGRNVSGDVVFVVSVDGSGNVTLDQQRAIEHDPNVDADDVESLSAAAAAALQLTATVTDDDGDSASQTVSVGAALSFADDGPSFTQDLGALAVTVSLDETDPALEAGSSGLNNPVTSAASIISYATATGADGGSTDVSLLITTNQPTGIATTAGQEITLVYGDDNGTVLGQYVVDDSDLDNIVYGTAFTIEIDESGFLTVTLHESLQHPDPADDDENINPDLAGLLAAQVTVTDGDGDVVSQSVDIGALIIFEDDAPTIGMPNIIVGASAAGPLCVTGTFDLNAGSDGLQTLTAALGAGGSLEGEAFTLVEVGTTTSGLTEYNAVSDVDGETLFTFYIETDGSTLSAFSDPAGVNPFFTLSLDSDGNYTFYLLDDSLVTTVTVDGGAFGASGPGGSLATIDGTIVAKADANTADGYQFLDDVNASENGIAVENVRISNGEAVQLEFKQPDPGANGLPNPQSYVSFNLVQWGGTNGAALLITVAAVGGTSFTFAEAADIIKPADGVANVLITQATGAPGEEAGDIYIDPVTGDAIFYVSFEFDSVIVEHDGNMDGFSSDAEFAINDITYNASIDIQDLNLDFLASASDGDDDPATASFNVEIQSNENEAGGEDLVGTDGEDHIYGTDSDDDLSGGAGNDQLYGGAGDDILNGGANDDLLAGGLGSDMLTGGSGADRFVFSLSVDASTDGDSITDFSVSEGDVLEFTDVIDIGGDGLSISDVIASVDFGLNDGTAPNVVTVTLTNGATIAINDVEGALTGTEPDDLAAIIGAINGPIV